MKKQMLILAVVALATVSAMAATQATNNNKVSPTLQIQATVQSAVRLTLQTGTAAVTHCAVTNPGPTDYTMNFGTVDALAINAGNCNVFAPTTPGVSPAIYWSDYDLTPVFTGQTTTNNTITAQVTTNFAATTGLAVVRDSANSSTVPVGVASFTAMGVGSADTIATNAANGTQIIRFIGVQVSPNNTATTTNGAQTATVTFTLTVQ